MVTKKSLNNKTDSTSNESVLIKAQVKNKILLKGKNLLSGDLPNVLDFREISLKHKGEIRIAGNDLIEIIHFSDSEFFNVIISDLPNLKEIHAHGIGPTWVDCQNLPNLKKLIIDSGTRWLNVNHAENLSEIDVGDCEHLGYLSIQQAPLLKRVNVEHCRLLPFIQGMSIEDQDRLELTKQIEAVQKMSKRDSSLYPKMTFTDIDQVLVNIQRGQVILINQFPDGDAAIYPPEESPSYVYRLLDPGEKVYTGGTGESYCYAFEEITKETKGKKLITIVHEQLGIHEPEDAISMAISRVISRLGIPRKIEPTNVQFLEYLNLLLNSHNVDATSWIKTADEELRLALAANPLMPANTLEQLGKDSNSQIRLKIAENPAAEFVVRQKLLHSLIKEKDQAIRICIASSDAISPQDLESLSKDSNVKTLCAISQNPICPKKLRASILETLSSCGEQIGLLLVANSSDAREQLFDKLLASADIPVMVAISENINAPESARSAALEHLASIDDPQVKRSVAKNKLTPPAVLEKFGQTSDTALIGLISSNPATPASSLEFLAKSEDPEVRLKVAGNPSTPPCTLLMLAKDADPFLGEYIRKSVAGNPSSPQAAFNLLIEDKDWLTRLAIAKNISTPVSVFEILAKDTEYSVREHVAKNIGAPASALEILSTDAKDNIKMHVARNPNSNADTLTRLATDPHYATRRDVANNSGTPNSVIELLLKDSEQEVRTAAEKSFSLTKS
jgi:hypothetical protein